MGCGISRYDHLHEDDDAHHPLPPNHKDHNHPPDPILLNNPAKDKARNPLLFNTNINTKQGQQIVNGSNSCTSDPNINYLLKHKQQQPQPQIISPSTLTSIRHDPTMYIQISTVKGNNVNNRDHAEPKLSISIKRDLGNDKEEDDDDDKRISNLDDIDASSLLIGSPSFREYCVVRHDSHDFDDDDDEDLFNKYSHNGNKNNIDDQEREIKMQREDKIMMMSNHEGSGRKKGDRRRRLKKVFPIIHRRPAPNK